MDGQRAVSILASPLASTTSGNVKARFSTFHKEDYQYHFAIIEDPFSQDLSNGSSLAIHQDNNIRSKSF